jgi:hypothetical protein
MGGRHQGAQVVRLHGLLLMHSLLTRACDSPHCPCYPNEQSIRRFQTWCARGDYYETRTDSGRCWQGFS